MFNMDHLPIVLIFVIMTSILGLTIFLLEDKDSNTLKDNVNEFYFLKNEIQRLFKERQELAQLIIELNDEFLEIKKNILQELNTADDKEIEKMVFEIKQETSKIQQDNDNEKTLF